ncbi:hypothetical protein PR202_ga29990 [Eleusine coracana subsp. coracana]|uniref:Seed maturation protein n=1 Tax=Eleusine coracana subsp. coracana TaxID=191504 RepID=A0AAV5DNH0_ELECO|nr:hypothetical protein QOZ80_6AG0521670 [Eleusine coracana subsp. coracana]GJN11771.1 hypothetical protein PR202_ga29990 [Eleusine coracana subsp. coracana]
MQGGKSASVVESAKEAAANMGASAWAGKEKTQAVVEEKVAKARAHDLDEKAAADARMQERIRSAEAAKQDAMRHNAAAKERATAAVHQPTLPQPPARRTLDGRDATLPGAHLVSGAHVAGAPETAAAPSSGGAAFVNDAPRAGTTDGYPTATGRLS